jgi:hypothetical protein
VGRASSPRRADFFADTIEVPNLLLHQESVGGDAQAGVVVEAAPAPSFIVPQPHFLLEDLVVALDAPAHLGFKHQALVQ